MFGETSSGQAFGSGHCCVVLRTGFRDFVRPWDGFPSLPAHGTAGSSPAGTDPRGTLGRGAGHRAYHVWSGRWRRAWALMMAMQLALMLEVISRQRKIRTGCLRPTRASTPVSTVPHLGVGPRTGF